jgi:DHA2 family methylenomycin A resistance protein-like MFS transporter
MSFGGAALTSGPIIGGLITSFASWRYIFLVNLPVCLVGIALTLRYVEAAPKSTVRGNDWLGQSLILVASTALLTLIINYTGLSGLTSLALGIVAVAGLLLFLLTEQRAANPAIPLGVFSSPGLQRALVLGVVVNFLYFGIVFFASLYFRDKLNMSSLQAGLAFVPTESTPRTRPIHYNRLRFPYPGIALARLAGDAQFVLAYATGLRAHFVWRWLHYADDYSNRAASHRT